MKPINDACKTLVFFVNGKKVVEENANPEWTLLYYLRDKLRLCGTKLGCAEGGCGACTVMLSKYDRSNRKVIHLAVNACLAPVCSMHGLSVTTVEGLGSVASGRLHATQERLAKAHGSQCGFCTPGFVMSMYALLRNSPKKPTMQEIETAFQGNLCRCTGYRPILEGFRTFSEEWELNQRINGESNGVCSMGKDCCRFKQGDKSPSKETVTNGHGSHTTNGNADQPCCQLFDPSSFKPYDPSQEPIFPPELKVSDEYDKQFLEIKGDSVTWVRPTSLNQLLLLKQDHPDAKIINGNTEIGIEVKFKNCHYPVLIQPNLIPELTEIVKQTDSIKLGASVTLTDMETALEEQIKIEPEHKTRVFKAIVEMMRWFAGKQIRNVGVIGGNIMTGSPISDLNPIFMAARCKLELRSSVGTRTVTMDQSFWTGYRKNIVRPEEILVAIYIPYSSENQSFTAYKQAKRRDDDIAIVNAAFSAKMMGTKIEEIIMCYGGMAPTTVEAPITSQALRGKNWDTTMLEEAYQLLMKDLPLDPGAPGGMAMYRRSLTLSFFFKFYVRVCGELEKKGLPINIPETHRSAQQPLTNLTCKSSQYFTVVPSTQQKHDLIGRPVVHLSAFKQTSGEAVYCDDMPRQEGELSLALVLSTRPHARLISVDPTAALALPGVVAFFSSQDIDPQHNTCGPVELDENIFASGEVTCQGQVIGAIVAEDPLIAQKAKKLVKVEYEDLKPLIITIEDAIREKSFLVPVMKVSHGDVDKAFAEAENVVEGEVRVGGQEHFYLETLACIAIPKKEDSEMEIFCSTQHPTELQQLVAHMLGVPSNRIVCKVKRMGGGFGGKESRCTVLTLPVAFAAHKLGRPVRSMLDRDDDMISTGQRHPFLGRYKLAFTSEGKFTACHMTLYNNAGNSRDLSDAVMERAMCHFENACHIPNIYCEGYVCKTNLPSNTAFRGFGAPQAMLIGETMYRHAASVLNKDIMKVIEMNLFKEGDVTHFNQEMKYCTVARCWNECKESSKFDERRKTVEEFNRTNRWRKRGIAMVPTMFGIAFTVQFLNQAGALVLVYTDGSVLISHGGTEMGQGLHTKMIQVASRALGISVEKIHIGDTTTDKVPNTSPTAASASSDLNGMAIIDACEQINQRLKPIKEANPKGKWEDWIKTAYTKRVSLAASGFYKTPDIGYDFAANKGLAFNYFTFGAACSEVEIDCLTGDHQVLGTEIVMDIGESLNPALDVGQVEGAFAQGYGLFTLEELIVSPEGLLYSRGPGTYKLPSMADTPAQFTVSLLKGAPNPRAVYSSKAVGEPPLFLASSVFFAIREAIKSSRKEFGLESWFELNSPATPEKIRLACSDHITSKFGEAPIGSYKPWSVVP